MHHIFEDAASVLEIFKLIEARASGSQQHGVSRGCSPVGFLNSRLQRLGIKEVNSRAELRGYLFGRHSDEHHAPSLALELWPQD